MSSKKKKKKPLPPNGMMFCPTRRDAFLSGRELSKETKNNTI
jgi:hypothetical protein